MESLEFCFHGAGWLLLYYMLNKHIMHKIISFVCKTKRKSDKPLDVCREIQQVYIAPVVADIKRISHCLVVKILVLICNYIYFLITPQDVGMFCTTTLPIKTYNCIYHKAKDQPV